MFRRPGADAIVLFQGKILLVLRDDISTISSPNMWNMPGGGIDEGETPEDAVKRELQEEICISPKYVRFLEEINYDNTGRVFRFLVELTEDEFMQVRLGNEGQRFDWFTFDQLEEIKISSGNKRFFDERAGLIKAFMQASEKRFF